LLGLAGAFLLAAHLAYFWRATCDDAFISLRYARNWASGLGLVFNPGERVEGFSNFLWVAVLAAAAALGADPLAASKVAGVFSLAVWIAAWVALARRAGLGRLERGGLLLLLGCAWPVAYYAVSGMETAFYAGWLALAANAVAGSGGRLSLGAGACLLGAALSRPEGAIFFPLFAFVHWATRHGTRSLAAPALLFGAVFGSFVLWRWSYYGSWIPNTYLVKSPLREGLGGPWGRLFLGGLDEGFEFVASTGGPLVGLLAAAGIWRNRRPATLASGVALGGGLFFLKFAGGDWMRGYRYLVPFLPAYWLLALAGWQELRARLRLPPRVLAATTSFALVAVGLFSLAGTVDFHRNRGRYPFFVMTSEDMVRAARWIDRHYPPGTEIVSWRIGALGYCSRLSVIDTWGLTDATIARMRYQRRFSPEALEAYLDRRDPRLVLTADRLEPGAEKTFGRRRYRVVKVFPQGTHSVWTLFEKVE
jgi:hypothetical protein